MSSRLTKIGRSLKALSLAEWIALVQAMVVIPLVALALRSAGLRRTHGALAKVSKLKHPVGDDFAEAQRYARIVTIAGGYGLHRPNCLERSLTLWAILRRHRIETQLRIGVSAPRDDQGLMFHAWIELDEQVVNDRSDIATHYRPFDSSIDPAPSAFDR